MAESRLSYREGDVFAVPLHDGSHAIGVVARIGNGAVLGYFFDQRYENVPDISDVGELSHRSAGLIQIFGDLGLIRGTWPVLGQLPSWQREEWPMPAFGRR